MTLIAVPITSASPPLQEQVRDARRGGADLIELRVDCIGDVAAVETLLPEPHDGRFTLTMRPAEEGGPREGDAAERSHCTSGWVSCAGLLDIARQPCAREPAPEDRPGLQPETAVQRSLRGPTENQLTFRTNRRETPDDVAAILEQLASTPPPSLRPLFTLRCRRCGASRGYRRSAQRVRRSASRWAKRIVDCVLPGRSLSDIRSHAGQQVFGPGQPCWTIFATRPLGLDRRHASSELSAGRPPFTQPGDSNAALKGDGIDALYFPLPVCAELYGLCSLQDY